MRQRRIATGWRLAFALLAVRACAAGCGSVPPSSIEFGAPAVALAEPYTSCCRSSKALSCAHVKPCQCAMPGCTCQVEWGSTELKYSHMDVEAVEVEVNVSCASVRRAGVHTLESVRVTMNGFSRDAVEMLDPPVVLRECFSPDELLASGDGAQQSPERLPELRAHNRSSAGSEEADELRERCAVRAQLLRRRTVQTAHIHAHALKHYNKLISFEVQVGPACVLRV